MKTRTIPQADDSTADMDRQLLTWSCRAGTEADHDARGATCGRPVWARPLPPPRQTLCDACFDRNYS